MANVVQEPARLATAGAPLAAGNTLQAGDVFPVKTVSTRLANIIKHKVNLTRMGFAITASGGGAADAKGQKLMTLQPGTYMVLAVRPNFTVTTPAGLSVATAVFALGTAAATDANAALTSTEADVIGSQTLGDGTLAAGATETENAAIAAAATTILSSASEIPIYFNVGGTFTHASVTDQTFQINGYVELVVIDMGAL